MRRKLPTILALFTTFAALLPAAAADRDHASAARPEGGVVRGDLGRAGAGHPRATARRALEGSAIQLGVHPSDVRFDSIRRSIVGLHVRGREYRDGVPVAGTYAAVHIVAGRIRQMEAWSLADTPGRPTSDPIRRDVAVAVARDALDIRQTVRPPRAERLLVAGDRRLLDVWHVSLLSSAPPLAADVDVDARTGEVLGVTDPRVFDAPTATVFDPNPIVSLKDESIRQPGFDAAGVDTDLNSPELTDALTKLPMRDLDAAALMAGRLVGPWVDVQGPAPLASVDGNFEFRRSDPRFEATMAYAHIDRLQRYFMSLGFRGGSGINNEPQNVYALPVLGFDNSFYQPDYDLILFGAGGVDDAEDAEVIVHEYGHAVHHAQVEDWGGTPEGAAMGEGWGDFLAASYFAKVSGGFQDECFADWDSTSYSDDDPTCLRRLDAPKIYPDDMEAEEHADGEIWSAFLWRLRERLVPAKNVKMKKAKLTAARSDAAIRLVLTSHEFLSPMAEFSDAISALKTAADGLGHPEWIPLIKRTAAETNLPR
ncbi:MAG: M36 family metallopeptidase [Actinomycetota bacterium]